MANLKECAKAGINPRDVDRIARRMEKLCADAKKLGVGIHVGSANYLWFDDSGDGVLVLGRFNYQCNLDGGDGVHFVKADGYDRGESD